MHVSVMAFGGRDDPGKTILSLRPRTLGTFHRPSMLVPGRPLARLPGETGDRAICLLTATVRRYDQVGALPHERRWAGEVKCVIPDPFSCAWAGVQFRRRLTADERRDAVRAVLHDRGMVRRITRQAQLLAFGLRDRIVLYSSSVAPFGR
jgi:hypothetical protein